MLRRTLCPIIVGREDEISAFEQALRSASAGDGRVVLVAGDAGIGKTRLVSELAQRASADGLPVLRGGCSETDLQVPYLPFVEAIRNHGRRNPASPIPAGLDDPAGLAADGRMDPTQWRARFFESVVDALERLAGDRGAVLIIEDLHWADAGTRDLLDYVARSLPGSRLLVVVTYRGDEVERGHPLLPMVRGWVRTNLATMIELEPLGADDIEGMLVAMLGEHEGGLAVRLHERCEGNPFVLEEILKVGGAELAEPTLPATVRDAILRRVERLAPAHLDVLRATAVLGEPIDDSILVDLLGDEVPEALEECARQQLVTVSASGSYAWRHALTREAVYEDMAPARRRRLHSALADLCDGRPGVDDVAICRHLAAAGRWDMAVPRCREAAAAATAIGAFADAARLLELSLPHADERERAEILDELPELLMQSGRPDAGETFARKAVELHDRRGDEVASAAARRMLAVCLWQQARWAEAIVLEDQAIAALEGLGPSPSLVAALSRRASWAVLAEADLRVAVRLVGRAHRIADEHGFDPDLYRADEGQVLGTSGRVDEGLAIMDDGWRNRLRPSAEGRSDWREGKFMLHHAVAFRNLLGRTDESLAILASTPSSPAGQDAADTSLAVVRIEAIWAHGEVTRAQRLLAGLDLSRIERAVVPWAQAVRADVLLSAGETGEAAALARNAMPPHWQPVGQLRVAGLVRVLVQVGDLAAALELGRRLERVGGYSIELRLPLIDAVIEANLAAGRTPEAAGLAIQVAEARPDDPRRLRVEARMLLANGADVAAIERLRAAIAGFVRAGHRQDEWHSRRLVARVLRNLGQRREAGTELRRIESDVAAANGSESPIPGSSRGSSLSPREREVAVLIAQGLRNREIAERLFISERTVENHIHRVLERSGLRSRFDLASLITGLSGGLSSSVG
jgi:DNA-binding NarL/FixJ family response regulator/tetratricopeptide (TPR) repeat protein